ncbi:hypothetical protein HB976_14885 [Yersinia mollaretii]|nr:hypothetical protein [Yersinia mollaretii]
MPIKGRTLHAKDYAPLTHTEVQKAKAIDKDLTLHDGDGLFLLVKTTGKKIWRFRYQLPNSAWCKPCVLFCTFNLSRED